MKRGKHELSPIDPVSSMDEIQIEQNSYNSKNGM